MGVILLEELCGPELLCGYCHLDICVTHAVTHAASLLYRIAGVNRANGNNVRCRLCGD